MMKGLITAILIGLGSTVALAQPTAPAQASASNDVGGMLEEWLESNVSDSDELVTLLAELLALAESLDFQD